MKRKLITLLLTLTTLGAWATTETNPTAVVNLVNRVCGTGAATHFTFTLDDTFNGGAEAFQLGAADGKVTVTANTMSALTCGLNWYLNHEAHVNIAWNNLRQNVTSFPGPSDTSVHQAQHGQYRYYLNYCTYSYSMAFYNWDRWEKEIDWMALHGVNLPLVVVGMDAVWYRMLTASTADGGFGMSHDDATAFIAGPAFQGWWLMNNITNVGGNNPEWWYNRQARLGKQITDRMRDLGMNPCLPGFVGMAPQSIAGSNPYTGKWNGCNSPCIINASQTTTFNNIAEKYYTFINKVFGFWPNSYSMDPFHERGLPQGVDYAGVCTNSRNAIVNYGHCANPLWVAQEWQDNADQGRINALLGTNALLLDLCSERVTKYQGRYKTLPYAFCCLNNYGGNIGMHGMLNAMLTNYHAYKNNSGDGTHGVLSGVGVTPEGIENNPMVYDLLFELPWMATVPTTADDWLRNYTESRYGSTSDDVKTAWLNLLGTNDNRSIYNNNRTGQQGCQEPIFCARPNLSGNNASQWASSTYYWDKSKVIEAAYKLLTLSSAQNSANYDYDVVDFVRQAITDYAHTLQMDMAGQSYTGARFAQQVEGFYQMMDDVDALLGTLEDFRLGRWIGAARNITTEPEFVSGNVGSRTAVDWLEWNARLLITTWFDNQQTLIDYANREYQGLITGYYKPRWKAYFDKLKAGQSAPNGDWYFNNVEIPFTNGTLTGSPAYDGYKAGQATGNAVATARAMMQKYFGKLSNGKYYSPNITVNASDIKIAVKTAADLNKVFKNMTTGSSIAKFNLDMDGDGQFDEANDKNVSDWEEVNSVSVTVPARVITTDGAIITFLASIGEDLDAPRTVTVATSDATMGSVKIKGYTGKSVSNTKAVTVIATANEGHQFLHWRDADGNIASAMATYTYAQAEPITLIANFKKWIDVEQSDAAIDETKKHSACLTSISYKAGSATGYTNIYTANAAPTNNVFTILDNFISANPGDEIKIKWTGAAGMKYCYLSAYYDTDANGIFDANPFTTLGTKGAENSAVTNNEIKLQIPADAQGLTRVRLRFDGAWNTGYDSSISAWPAQAVTNRPVYDINIQVGSVEPNVSWTQITKKDTWNNPSWFLTQLSLNNEAVYNGTDNAGSPFVVGHQTAELKKNLDGSLTVAVHFAGTDMNKSRLSLYLDINGDGDFDDTNEAIGILDNYDQNNTMLSDCSFSFTLPSTTSFTDGITRLRFRFDDATLARYNNTSLYGDQKTNLLNPSTTWYIYKPDLPTAGTVYDIPVMFVGPYAPWSEVTETGGGGSSAPGGANSEDGKNHDAGAWLTSLTINGTEVYTNSNADPVQTIIDAVSQVTLNPGGTYTVVWTANDQMKWARLTAYYDLDGDGMFEEATADSAGDCLGVMGGYRPNASSGNSTLPSNSFTFTMPADAAIGVSCLRLRFDDAWQNPTGVTNSVCEFGGSNKTQPMLSTSRSSRNVYDVHVAIEEVQWEDAELTIGGLVFDGQVSKNSSDAVLDEYKSGLTNNVMLTHTATSDNKEYTVADLTPVFDVLKTVNSATTVTIASDVDLLGEAYTAYVPKRSTGYEEGKAVSATNNGVTYNGTQYCWDLDPVLSGNCWNLNVKVRFGEQQFNQWGICTLASGTEPTPADNSEAAKFNSGFQFYQNAESNNNRGLILRSNTVNHTIAKADDSMIYLLNCTATFELKYRNGNLRILLFTDDGTSIDVTYATNITSISNLCGKFGSDSEILGLTYNFINEESTEPVTATTWLNNENITIQLEDGYTGRYDIDENGSLWGSARQQQLLRVPSAIQLAGNHNRFTVPASMLAISPDAFVNNPTAKINLDLQRYLMVDDLLKPTNVSMAMSETSDGEETLMHATEATFAEVTLDRKPSATKWNTFVLPFNISGDEMEEYISEVYDFSGVKASGENITINFTRHTGAMTAGEPYLVKGTEAAADGLVFSSKSINVSPATKEFEAGNYTVLVHGKYDRIPLHGDNIYYISNNKFYYANTEVTMKGFRAYIEVVENTSNAPAQVALLDFSLGDIETGVDEIEVQLTPDAMYNLSGQRVYRAKGIVIRDGKKVIVK